MKIGIDFDRTIFKTDEFDSFYKDHVKGLHHVEEPAPVKHGCYDPEKHARICEIPVERIWKVFENDLSKFIYPDIKLLNKLEDHELKLVTRGHERFQREKIEASDVKKYFDEVHVVQEKPKDSIDIELLVDDSTEELQRVEVKTLQIRRPEEGIQKLVDEVEK